ncbi:unnamed protein product [Ilex paraguariensis]|uniref:Uncharacterized protein n=1 Tax=Ilex paraguariensis TaxID=185542 RepID=A0ABC8RT65_9AQUA
MGTMVMTSIKQTRQGQRATVKKEHFLSMKSSSSSSRRDGLSAMGRAHLGGGAVEDGLAIVAEKKKKKYKDKFHRSERQSKTGCVNDGEQRSKRQQIDGCESLDGSPRQNCGYLKKQSHLGLWPVFN